MSVMKKINLIILITLTQACVVKKRLQSGINLVMDRVVIVPVAVTQFLTEASSKIYTIDSLSDKTPVLIKTFDVKLYSNRDSLEFNFKDIKFYFSQDTAHYSNFIFPKWNLYKYADTMRGVVNCFFTTPKSSGIRCLVGTYMIINGTILNQKEYKFCSQ